MKALVLTLSVLSAIITSNVAYSGDYEDGISAYRSGQYETAIDLLRKAGDQGHPQAQYYLSVLYEGASGIDRDTKASFHWLQKAAEGGMVEAQRNLAAFYHDGIDAPDDDLQQAIYWYRRTANQGDLNGQLNLGMLLDQKSNSERDHREAIRWYLLAARHGVAQAQFYLGLMHDEGRGTPVNHHKALVWLNEAAELRYPEAMLTLGVKYHKGQGVEQDFISAYKWFLLADLNGHPAAVKHRKAVVVKLTPELIAVAENLVDQWLDIH
ncbi:tetratricopeptide repeat protein [Kiloniella sp.]|uniref:tetratricopeptide repeat protein n=1 Tax=Kiloniella sp. TaxID=1938587 RepID=UPI003B021F91